MPADSHFAHDLPARVIAQTLACGWPKGPLIVARKRMMVPSRPITTTTVRHRPLTEW
jgi:hypothetical protein